MASKLTYKDAGVDIDAGNKTVELIKPLAKSTYRKEVLSGIGSFSGLFEIPKGYKEPVLVASTDGVGTKLKLAFKLKKHDTIGIDLVAMCVNDLICTGAEPLFFLDYFATSKLDPKVAQEIIKGITKGCLEAHCTLLGGETAELPAFYKRNEYDLAGFAVGVVEKDKIIDGKNIKPGDSLIGIESSGLHSNGYSLALKVFFDIAKWDINFKHPNLKQEVGELLLTPTFIYSNLIQILKSKFEIEGIANITGGGLTENLPRIFPKNTACEINLSSWKRQAIFYLIQELGNIEDSEMLRTFNCGIGIVLIVSSKDEKQIINQISKIEKGKRNYFKSYKIGEITQGTSKVLYKGTFSD